MYKTKWKRILKCKKNPKTLKKNLSMYLIVLWCTGECRQTERQMGKTNTEADGQDITVRHMCLKVEWDSTVLCALFWAETQMGELKGLCGSQVLCVTIFRLLFFVAFLLFPSNNSFLHREWALRTIKQNVSPLFSITAYLSFLFSFTTLWTVLLQTYVSQSMV